MRTIHREIVGGFLVSADGKILLGQNYKGGVFTGQWVCPGGGIEQGETTLDALRREILQETGLDVSMGKITDVSSGQHINSTKTLRDTGETVRVEMDFFDYKIAMPLPAKDLPPKSGDDFESAQWFTPIELTSLDLSTTTKKVIQKLGLLPA